MKRIALAMLAGSMAFTLPAPAAAGSAAYFHARAVKSDVPTLLTQADRDYYRALFAAIDRQDWTQVQLMLAQRKDGPLQQVALAEYYLAARSPKVELPQIQEWLQSGRSLPQADQMARLGLKRGLTALPDIPAGRRRETALGHLARNAGNWNEAEHDALAEQVLSLIDDTRFAPVFADGSRAEVAIAGRLTTRRGDPVLVSGQIDRLAVTPEAILIVDYKTGHAPPASAAARRRDRPR